MERQGHRPDGPDSPKSSAAALSTKEGTLQVDLAHLNYQKGRLVRSWTHLERQRGGAGFMGGPGETQIEADRRMLQDKIIKLEKELEQVRRTRSSIAPSDAKCRIRSSRSSVTPMPANRRSSTVSQARAFWRGHAVRYP